MASASASAKSRGGNRCSCNLSSWVCNSGSRSRATDRQRSANSWRCRASFSVTEPFCKCCGNSEKRTESYSGAKLRSSFLTVRISRIKFVAYPCFSVAAANRMTGRHSASLQWLASKFSFCSATSRNEVRYSLKVLCRKSTRPGEGSRSIPLRSIRPVMISSGSADFPKRASRSSTIFKASSRVNEEVCRCTIIS